MRLTQRVDRLSRKVGAAACACQAVPYRLLRYDDRAVAPWLDGEPAPPCGLCGLPAREIHVVYCDWRVAAGDALPGDALPGPDDLLGALSPGA